MEYQLTCPNCNHTGDDVIVRFLHVGGKGDLEPQIQCRDETRCWKRWDEQNGFKEVSNERSR